MMFRCFLRPRGRLHIPPTWLPSIASSGSRGIKLVKAVAENTTFSRYAPVAKPVTGREWLQELTRNNIGHFTEMEKIRTLKGLLIIKASPRHVRKFSDGDYFTDMGHPMAEAVVRRYLREHKEKPLWAITTVLSSDKAIVRGKFKYRAHAAFNQALLNAGYDISGKRAANSKGGARNGAVSELFGTVEIVTFAPKEIQNVPFTTLREFFEKVVGNLEQGLGKTAGGHHAGRDSKTPRVQVRRPQHQADDRTTKRTDMRSPAKNGSDRSRQGTQHGRGNDGKGNRKSGGSREDPTRQSR